MNNAMDQFEKVVSEIIVSSQNLAQAVEQIASGNQNLSQRTSEQASSLEEIASTIDLSVAAWEKRGYWVKADRFRMDWIWTEHLGGVMRQAVLSEDWATVARTVGQVGEKLSGVKVPLHNRVGTPWYGALRVLAQKN